MEKTIEASTLYDYNTQRKRLALPEYGRNIHKMVQQLMSIEDREKRNQQAHAVIAVMGNLFPYLRDINDFKHKLWDHIFIISDFQLDIDSPYPKPVPATFEEKPRPVPYSNPDEIKFKHYGKSTQTMVSFVASLPGGELRERFVIALANHMKRAYLSWNKDVVGDDIIFKDIDTLSNGKIKIDAGTQLVVGNYSSSSQQQNSNLGMSRSGNNGGNGKPRQQQLQHKRKIIKQQ